jgi:sarcosine oxidase subunit gamma
VRLNKRSALNAASVPGRYGARSEGAPVTLSEQAGCALAIITARKGKASEAADALATLAQVRPIDRPALVVQDGITLIGCAPGQWFVIADGHRADGFLTSLRHACEAVASVTDHSAGREIVRVSGARARDVLAKGCTIDLNPRSFKPGDAATTRIGLIDATLWQVDDAPTYAIAVDRSIAASFWAWLATSAAEYGYEVK